MAKRFTNFSPKYADEAKQHVTAYTQIWLRLFSQRPSLETSLLLTVATRAPHESAKKIFRRHNN
jgi:hypothetical protein